MSLAYPCVEELKEFPHACKAVSDVAIWGSRESVLASETSVPSTADELSALSDEGIYSDDQHAAHGGLAEESGQTVPS